MMETGISSLDPLVSSLGYQDPRLETSGSRWILGITRSALTVDYGPFVKVRKGLCQVYKGMSKALCQLESPFEWHLAKALCHPFALLCRAQRPLSMSL